MCQAAAMSDRYGFDVLRNDPHRPAKPNELPVEMGVVLECADSGFCGAIVDLTKTSAGWAVALEDRFGQVRLFPLTETTFMHEGVRVELVRPAPGSTSPRRTRSGSIAAPVTRARIARASRIWVEGIHDAELVEKVWGDDLRDVGVVVEPLHGADDLMTRLGEFAPSSQRRVGVLLDHLVANSKESRIAAQVRENFPSGVLVLGHPYVDVWEAVKPTCVGIAQWPVVERGEDWKTGVMRQLGWHGSTGSAWIHILSKVHSFQDIQPSLLGRVEELIDFVTDYAQ